MKTVMRKACGSDQHAVFLFADTQIKYEAFLEDVNNLLNMGEVPSLFTPEEKADICEKMKMIDQQKDKSLQTDGSDAALFSLFLNIVRQQLHVVMTMSPVGANFRAVIRRFPSLVSCCTIDWFQEWPPDALLDVASYLLSDVAVEKEACIQACQHFHVSAQELSLKLYRSTGRHNHVTPMSYLDLVHIFRDLLERKRTEVQTAQARYAAAISKLEHAMGEVAVLQGKLVELQPELQVAAKSVHSMTALVEKESSAVAEVEKMVKAQEMAANKKAAAVQATKEECESNLAAVTPALEDAIANLSSVTSQDVANIKSSKAPPPGVKMFMDIICILKDVKPDRSVDSGSGRTIDDYTAASKRLLGDKKLVESLLLLDKDNVPDSITEQLEERIPTEESIEAEVVQLQTVSPAAEVLLRWALATSKYALVRKGDATTRGQLRQSEAELVGAAEAAETQRAELQAVQDKLRALEEDLEGGRQRHAGLQAELELCQKKMQRAEELAGCLGGEQRRWSDAAEELRHLTHTLTGTATTTHVGVARTTPACVIPPHLNCTPSGHFPAPAYAAAWSAGVPASLAGGCDVTCALDSARSLRIINSKLLELYRNCRRFPLVIDCQGQASKWIRNLEKNNNLNIIRFQQTDYTRMLENALQLGQPVGGMATEPKNGE
ncbi:hypothetical protein PR048_008364 [Dryococelus australis]|uniref:Dynein heavy chain n=1 Tax=Dryococelus australis TaxID=614101 RepID=A0ABQ9HWW3_9NEOP|nr:hypothetical protein PR048_008364 [Dryococelus australis]